MTKIYLACPYSDPDMSIRIARFERANLAAGKLIEAGNLVFSPISHTHPIAVACNLPGDFGFWEAYDRTFLEWCDILYVLALDGWMESEGVNQEIAIARELKKPMRLMSEEE